MSHPPSAAYVERALARLPRSRRTWAAALHLATPTTVLVGAHVRVDGNRARYRGFETGPQTPDAAGFARAAAALSVCGHRDTDTYFSLDGDPDTWLAPVRSGSGYVVAGAREILDLAPTWCETLAEARQYANSPTSTAPPHVALTAAAACSPCALPHRAAAQSAAEELSVLRHRWAVAQVDFVPAEWPLEGMSAWALTSDRGTATLVVGPTFRQTLKA